LPELNLHNIYKDFITAGMKILDNEGQEEELKNFNQIFIDLNELAKKQIFFSAAQYGNEKIVRHMLDIELESHNSESIYKECFEIAVEFGNVETADLLLKRKLIKLDERKNFSYLFNCSIEKDHVEMVEFLMKNGSILGNKHSNIGVDEVANVKRAMNIMKEEESGNLGRALDFAIEKGSLNLVEYFLQIRNQHIYIKSKITYFHLAIEKNQTEVIKILLEKEASLVGEKYISNLLKLASEKNDHEVIRFLLAKEDGINLSDSPNLNLVHLAIKNGHEEFAKFLLEEEEKKGVQRGNYADLLRLAIQNNRVEMAKFLLEKEESRGIQRIDYNEMLLFATRKKYTSMCALFIKKGADFVVNFQNRALLSSIIDGAMIVTNRVLASNNKEMEILALALNERGGEIKKLDLSKIYPNQTGRQSLKTKDNAIRLFNENVQCFFKAMRLPELQELDLNDNNLNSICIDFVAKSSPKLKKLNLAGNDFFHKHTSSINKIFSKLVAIEDLDLSRNNIDFTKPKKIEGFITWLSNTRTLEKLNLSGNATENNVKSFCDIIKQNKLTELNISHNKIDEDGIKKIATSLATNSTLKILDLSGNNITPAGLQALYQALEKNNTLQSFGDIEINADIERILERNRQRHISQGGEDLQPASKRLRQSEDGGGASTADGGVARIEVGGGAKIEDGGGGSQNRGFEALRGERGVGQKRTYLEALLRGPPSAIVSGGGGVNLQSPAQSQSSLGPN
jgi:ankyrin repeat protein